MRWRPGACGDRYRRYHSREQPFRPPRSFAFAAINQPVMQAKGPIAPKFDLERTQAKTRPVIRTRHFGERVFGGVFGDLFFERPAPFHGPRLGRGPGPTLA